MKIFQMSTTFFHFISITSATFGNGTVFTSGCLSVCILVW